MLKYTPASFLRQSKIRELLKGEAVADLEKRMHSALDDAMATIKGVVANDIKVELGPIKQDVERLKAAAA
jgi:hypothetical protein